MRTLKLLLLGLLAFGPLASAWADLVVVTNPKSGIDRMSREEVVFVFLGRWRQLPSGIAAVPIDLPIDSPERAAFYRQLVSKSPSEIKAYWSRLMFSGGARPRSRQTAAKSRSGFSRRPQAPSVIWTVRRSITG